MVADDIFFKFIILRKYLYSLFKIHPSLSLSVQLRISLHQVNWWLDTEKPLSEPMLTQINDIISHSLCLHVADNITVNYKTHYNCVIVDLHTLTPYLTHSVYMLLITSQSITKHIVIV